MAWQLLALWLWAHSTTTFSFSGAVWQGSSAKVRAVQNGVELFRVDESGHLHLIEHDPAVIACAWVASVSSAKCRKE